MNAQALAKIQSFYAANQAAVDDLGSAIGVPGLWFCCLFYNESGCNASLIASSNRASGLNMMLPSTLQTYNLTPEQYAGGGVAFQCSIMKQLFKPVAGIIKRAGDLYLYNFWPAAITQNYAADFPIGLKGSTNVLDGLSQGEVYADNAGLDYNHDGVINRQDFWDGFEMKYDTIIDSTTPTTGYFLNDLWIDLQTNWIAWLLVIIVVVVLVLFISQNNIAI